MNILYKLTTSDFKTRKGFSNELTWGENVTHAALKLGTEMCSDQVIHAYPSTLLAVICNPIHADIRNPVLWEARGDVVASDGLKIGVKSLTTVSLVRLPVVTTNQRIVFAILCALEVCKSSGFVAWAQNWLSGKDRSARAAAWAARAAAWATEAAGAAGAAAWAARAAEAAARAARAAEAAAWAAEAAGAAARAAARAAWAAEAARAGRAGRKIDFSDLAEKAMTY